MAVDVNQYVVSNEAVDDGEELRRRMDRAGYLFFRGLLDPDQIRDLRHDVLEVCQQGGWLKAGAPLKDGIANGERVYLEPEPDYLEVYGRSPSGWRAFTGWHTRRRSWTSWRNWWARKYCPTRRRSPG